LLGDLIKLKKIYIREPEFSNFDFLEKLINLESLEIISTPIENITPLRSLINLKYLNLSNNRRIKKIDVITVLKGLRTLLIEPQNPKTP
jgi:Leucine-rich repeat (LRR) protein